MGACRLSSEALEEHAIASSDPTGKHHLRNL